MPALTGIFRRRWHRVIWQEGEEDEQAVQLASTVTITERLDGAQNRVAEFAVSGQSPPDAEVQLGKSVRIYQLRLDDADGEANMVTQFNGVVDRRSGSSWPQGMTITCTGVLSKLDYVPDADEDLTGMTEREAAQFILTESGIAFDEDDIDGWDYVLGQQVPVIWKANQPAADMMAELNRVFSMTLVEIGEGRPVRRYFEAYGWECDVDLDCDLLDATQLFARGRPGAAFYANARDVGPGDQIRNRWAVDGASWRGAEGGADEGCEFTVKATADGPHPTRPGHRSGIEPFESQLIQTEGLAKAIAERLIRTFNRVPDMIKVLTANQPRLSVGDPVSVLDAAYGVGIGARTGCLTTSIQRDGDLMTFEAVCGPAGELTDSVARIDRCCGTQQEDGTCTDVGEDPGPDAPPGGHLPDMPDPGVLDCDPIADLTCLPDDQWTLPDDDANYEDPYLDCSEVEGDDAFAHKEGLTVESAWRDISAGQTTWLVGFDTDTGSAIELSLADASGLGILTLNFTQPSSAKEPANDQTFSAGEVMCLTLDMESCTGDATVAVVYGPPSGGDTMSAGFYFGGLEVCPEGPLNPCATVGWSAGTGNSGPVWTTLDAVRNRSCGFDRNNGGYGGSPAGGRATVGVCFDPSGEYQRVTVTGGFGGGFMEDFRFSNECASVPVPLHYDPDSSGGKVLEIRVSGNAALSTPECPTITFYGFGVGYDTCVANPDYIPPAVDA
jgi:hypothetical protein